MRVFRHQKWFWLAAASLVSSLTAFWSIDVDLAHREAASPQPVVPKVPAADLVPMTDLTAPRGFREKVEARTEQRLDWSTEDAAFPTEPLVSEVVPAGFDAPRKPEVPPAVWLSGGIEVLPESSTR